MYVKVDNEFVLFVNENDSQEFGIVKKFESILGHSLFDNSRNIVFAILVFCPRSWKKAAAAWMKAAKI